MEAGETMVFFHNLQPFMLDDGLTLLTCNLGVIGSVQPGF